MMERAERVLKLHRTQHLSTPDTNPIYMNSSSSYHFFVTTSAAAGDAPAAAPAAKAAKPVEEEVDALDGGKNSLMSTA